MCYYLIMNKILGYLIPILGGLLILTALVAYYYLTALPDFTQPLQKVSEDKIYLNSNDEKYADCYYTVKQNDDFSITTTTNRLYNSGVNNTTLEKLETKFRKMHTDQCDPIINDYESRFKQYKIDQLELAKTKLSKLDNLLGKQPTIEKEHSNIVYFYEMYEPKSLQWPTNSSAKMLYSTDDYQKYVEQNL